MNVGLLACTPQAYHCIRLHSDLVFGALLHASAMLLDCLNLWASWEGE